MTGYQRMAINARVLSEILETDPEGITDDHLQVARSAFETIESVRKQCPELLTDAELLDQIAKAGANMRYMQEHPYQGDCGEADRLGAKIEALEAEASQRGIDPNEPPF